MQAVLGRIALARHALGIGRYQKHADAAAVALAALGARRDDEGVGGLAIQDDEFLAVDDPAIALLLCRCRDVGEIVARVLLELGERKGLAAVDNAGNVRGLLRRGAAVAQEAAADHHRREIRLKHQRTAERFHHDHGLDRPATETAVFFRERQAEQPLLRELAPHRLAPAALLLGVFLAALEVVRIRQQAVDAFLEKALLLGQIEIHVRSTQIATNTPAGASTISPSCPALCRASTSFAFRERRGWPGIGVLRTPFFKRLCPAMTTLQSRSLAAAEHDYQSPSTALVMMLRWISLEPP